MKLTNLSGFSDTGWLEFASGVNLIVGENNSGKSAILQAFKQGLDDNRHRQPDRYRFEQLPRPEQFVDCEATGAEIESGLLRVGPTNWPLAIQDETAQPAFWAFLRDSNSIWRLRRVAGGRFERAASPSHGLFSGHIGGYLVVQPSDGALAVVGMNSGAGDSAGEVFNVLWPEKVFFFDAQRFNVAKGGFNRPLRLSPTADNLPAYLNRVQGENPDSFNRIAEHLRQIFSTVHSVSVAPDPSNGNQVEIRVWPTDNRSDIALSFGLDSCGTGISQALAILTIAVTMDKSVIAVDEIGSFLHPSAAKSLLRILQTYYAQHQYIVSTHSGEIISASSASTTHFVTREGFESKVVKVDLANMDNLQTVAAQLGMSMSDVFAADHTIWVEGDTETACFRFLHEERNRMPRSPIFAALVATGDILKRRGELVIEVYRRLSQLTNPLVKSVTFGLDSEDLTGTEKEDLTRRSDNAVMFLPRRNLECYLIEPRAIARVIAKELDDVDEDSMVEKVDASLRAHANDSRYKAGAEWSGDLSEPAWLAKVDGAKLIRKVVAEVTETRLEFRKSRHSLMILKEVNALSTERVDELRRYVDALVTRSQR